MIRYAGRRVFDETILSHFLITDIVLLSSFDTWMVHESARSWYRILTQPDLMTRASITFRA
ncbi:MAG: hypothetical protein JXA71_03605 [Chitinispirillaceae bacterium]|nr:hypothetical protein [Chitinispirillaceae bacterium]